MAIFLDDAWIHCSYKLSAGSVLHLRLSGDVLSAGTQALPSLSRAEGKFLENLQGSCDY